MLSLNNYFDKIYCIHMEEATDRVDNINELSEKYNFEFEWFEAITPNNFKVPTLTHTPINFCCSMSHLFLWHKIKKEKFQRALILEDDITDEGKDVYKSFEILELNKDLIANENTDLFFLGTDYSVAEKDMIQINENIFKLQKGRRIHAYSPSLNFLYKISSKINFFTMYKKMKEESLIDGYLEKYLKDYECYTVKPSIFYQKEGYSYRLKRVLNKDTDENFKCDF